MRAPEVPREQNRKSKPGRQYHTFKLKTQENKMDNDKTLSVSIKSEFSLFKKMTEMLILPQMSDRTTERR